ncbi:Protein CBR-GST-38 [Caenorhabditis briggsae]|uniref:glutathione transferase n=1 Tax=Caenorhabditis briggsae TaxID=6238 RepID=A8Y374_CAEBR|nr:Protein CBR-GST-38 [Caenorhabditis briggsae]CAP39343.2 Protein CBR-GST-38 [Caenorhabditis briggsae]
MVSYKLTYFDGRGAGEICRQIFAYAGQEYEDQRLTDEQWEESPIQPTPNAHHRRKASCSIPRHVSLPCSRVWHQRENSFRRGSTRPYLAVKLGYTEGDADTLYKTVYLPAFKKHYGFLSKALKSSGHGFLVGDSLTWIDLLVAQHSADLLKREGESLFDEYPEMKTHSQDVQRIPQIAKWIEKRPVSDW